MKFEELPEFRKDLKALLKKYRSLKEDLEIVKKILVVLPDERPPFSYRINNLGIETCTIKVKKIACKSLKGKGVNSGLRLIYAYYAGETAPDSQNSDRTRPKIVFIELYHKKDKAVENRERILKNFK